MVPGTEQGPETYFLNKVNRKSYSNIGSVFLSGGNLLLIKEEPYKVIFIPKGHWRFSNTQCTFPGNRKETTFVTRPCKRCLEGLSCKIGCVSLWESSLAGGKWLSRKFEVCQLLIF